MKNVFLVLLVVFSTVCTAQKKKTSSKKTASKTVLANVDNLTAEIITANKQKRIVLYVMNDGVKETLELNNATHPFSEPIHFTITPFTANSVKLYLIRWEEKNIINTKLKKEDQDIVESQIWNIEKKELLLGNTQKSTHITETVFLDKNKTASETQERNIKEGFEFSLLPSGDVILKNKTQNNTYVYNAISNKYEIKKGSNSKPASSRKKR